MKNPIKSAWWYAVGLCSDSKGWHCSDCVPQTFEVSVASCGSAQKVHRLTDLHGVAAVELASACHSARLDQPVAIGVPHQCTCTELGT